VKRRGASRLYSLATFLPHLGAKNASVRRALSDLLRALPIAKLLLSWRLGRGHGNVAPAAIAPVANVPGGTAPGRPLLGVRDASLLGGLARSRRSLCVVCLDGRIEQGGHRQLERLRPRLRKLPERLHWLAGRLGGVRLFLVEDLLHAEHEGIA
jgi:hypothetical protein